MGSDIGLACGVGVADGVGLGDDVADGDGVIDGGISVGVDVAGNSVGVSVASGVGDGAPNPENVHDAIGKPIKIAAKKKALAQNTERRLLHNTSESFGSRPHS
jgi:hypothetical protein